MFYRALSYTTKSQQYVIKFVSNKSHVIPHVCSVCCADNPIFSSLVTYQRDCNQSNTTGSTCGAGPVCISRAPKFIPGFNLRLVLLKIWFYLYVLYIIAFPFVLFHLVIVLSFLLQFTASGHPFDIFKLFSLQHCIAWVLCTFYR